MLLNIHNSCIKLT